jgi:hypothetical protein
MGKFIVAAIVTIAAEVHADPSSYAQVDAFSVVLASFFGAGGGHRIADTPMWGHVEAGFGFGGSDNGVSYEEWLSGGVEALECLHPQICIVVGADIGGARKWGDLGYMHDATYAANELVAIGRGYLDFGGTAFRFRIGLEYGDALYAHGTKNPPNRTESIPTGVVKPLLGVAYRW